jgi:RNA polymerase sigma factor for flagellar operon FliA
MKLSPVQEKLVLENLDLAKKIAYSLHKTLPQHIMVEDIIADGYLGLIDAASKFDASFGYKFETYASFRIRGEILDQLRLADWAPRSLRSKHREIHAAIDSLALELGHDPSHAEVAVLLNWPEEEVKRILGESSASAISNIHTSIKVDGGQLDLSDILPDANVDISENEFEVLRDKLAAAMDKLTDREKIIIILYYVEEFSLKNIGNLFEFTESRACQIHTSALNTIWSECFPP